MHKRRRSGSSARRRMRDRNVHAASGPSAERCIAVLHRQ